MLVLLAILMVTAPVIEFEEQNKSSCKSQQAQDVQKLILLLLKIE